MAVKRCPRCGDLYLAAVDVCADCGETLEEVESEASVEYEAAISPRENAEFDEWELGTWTMEGRRLLDGMLLSAEIPRSWQATTLVTPRATRDQVDDLVAQVAESEEGVGVGETVGYEVSDWTDDALDRLVALLQRDRVPYRWDPDGDLEVAAEHEATVDAIFSELSGDEPDHVGPGSGNTGGVGATDRGEEVDDYEDDDDGMEGHHTLTELFLAADRLARNPTDLAAPTSLTDAHQRMAEMALPFGFSPQMWSAVADRAGELSALLADPACEVDAIEASAATLRDLLREYV